MSPRWSVGRRFEFVMILASHEAIKSSTLGLNGLRRSEPELPLSIVQDAAPEMWNLIGAGLKKQQLNADADWPTATASTSTS